MSIETMAKESGRVILENNTYINKAEFIKQSHVDYYKRVLDFPLELAKGNVPSHEVIHKFGRNSSVGSTFVPICESGFYRTPTTNISLEVVSSSANDTANGTGARSIYYEGLKALAGNLIEVSGTVQLNGQTAVTIPDNMIRLYRWYVSTSGTYATHATSSHDGSITIREVNSGDVWSTILLNSYGRGQSQIGCYTVPSGYEAYITSITYSTESDKEAEILMYKRENALDTLEPFSPMRLVTEINSAKGTSGIAYKYPIRFNEETDIFLIGKLKAGTGLMTVDFEIILIEK